MQLFQRGFLSGLGLCLVLIACNEPSTAQAPTKAITPTPAVAPSSQKAPDKALEQAALGLARAVVDGQNDAVYDYLALPQAPNPDTNVFLETVRDILKRSPGQIRLAYEKHDVPDPTREIYRVYFFDPGRINLKLPLRAEQGQLWMREFVSCLFEKTGDQWRVPFTLFESETEGPMRSDYSDE